MLLPRLPRALDERLDLGVIGDLAGPVASAAVFVVAYVGVWRLIGLDADDRLTLAELTGGRLPARAA